MIWLIVLVAALHTTECTEPHDVVSLDGDFNKLKTDALLEEYVAEIVKRLKTFKVPVHPRIRLFYQLLKRSMNQYTDRTADSVFVPHKYNLKSEYTDKHKENGEDYEKDKNTEKVIDEN